MRYDPENQPGLANLITIYSSLSGLAPEAVVAQFHDGGYAPFKEACATLVADEIGNLQSRYAEVIASGRLDAVLDHGREVAERVAFRKLEKCKQKIGLGRKRN
jgi:tryptophanyl-tRNA synthetase